MIPIGLHVLGEGPTPCDLMLIGDWPDRESAMTGRPFARRKYRENEIERFLTGYRIPSRDDLYITTWIKDWCGPDGDYAQADFDAATIELEEEIRRVNPKTIVCLGRNISRWFLGDVDLEEVHAIPWHIPIDSPRRLLFAQPGQVVICPQYSPAAGFRSPEISAAITYDFTQLEAYLAGEVEARILYDDPFPSPRYLELTTIDEVDEVMARGGRVGTDTEGWLWAPWSVQVCQEPGVAYVIRWRNQPLIDRFAEWVNAAPGLYTFVFHSALHDLAMFRVAGVDTRRITFHDTMIMAYNLQLEPQGLKPLCVRHCNMLMDSFDSVMGDAGYRLAVDWLFMVQENEEFFHAERCQAEFDRLTTTPYTDKKGKIKPGRKLRSLPKLPKSDLHKSVERCLGSKDPRKLWGDQVLDRHVAARPAYGAMWPATLDHVDPDKAISYAGRDADGTVRLEPRLVERLHAHGLWRVYCADLGTVPLIDRMQQVGIRPDLAHFRDLSSDLGFEIVEIQTRLAQQLMADGIPDDSAWSFNANSTYHVGDLLYERFRLDQLKKTPGGDPSTNDKVLEALEKSPDVQPHVRQLISTIREYRETYKLKHTFVDQIPDFVNRYPFDGRIHATFRITRVVSGRLAASDPNLLAMPKYGKFAKRFRKGFVCGDGHVFGSWDLSQAELRVLAHLSQDPVLLAAYRDKLDLHGRLAQRIFGGKAEDYEEGTERLAAKAINFGIPMGMTEVGLCVELKKNGVDVNEEDAGRWLAETMALYSAVPTYQQEKIAEAKRNGFVTDLCGRRRYIGGIRSSDRAVRSEAERFAFSTPIQAGAQEIMKVAEACVWQHTVLPRQDRGQWVEPLIQIHDDLLMEFDQQLLPDMDREMRYAMTQTFKGLSVPIETSGTWGVNWGAMEKIK